MKYLVLFNPLAGSKKESEINSLLPSPCEKYDITKIHDFESFFSKVSKDDKIIICGGDGTLNRFVNSADTSLIENEIYYLATGSGNDFLHDLGFDNCDKPIKINEYIRKLPCLYVKDKEYKFLNGIGFGIDGYVCKEVNRLKTEKGSNKKSGYILSALKGLLFAFKPVNATVTVDGKEYSYKKVWMVPAMKGRFFGGGMIIAPDQKRADDTVSVIAVHDLSPLKIAILFPSIFKGTHIKYTKYITIHNANTVIVRFDKPCDMQIDGETLTDVTEYTVTTKSKVNI